MVGYHTVMSLGQTHSDSGDAVVLVSHVISQDHVIKEHVTLQVGGYQGK